MIESKCQKNNSRKDRFLKHSRDNSRDNSHSRDSHSRDHDQSEQERASSEQSEQERASSSVVESDVNDQELQRIVRDESSEKLINEYVRRRFQSYLNNNVEDVDLWESIYYDFEYFTLRIWKMISSDNWIFIKKICLTQEFWLNQADQKSSRSEIMYKVSKKNYYADWTLIQIEKVEKAYEKVFRDTQIRKNKLQSFSV